MDEDTRDFDALFDWIDDAWYRLIEAVRVRDAFSARTLLWTFGEDEGQGGDGSYSATRLTQRDTYESPITEIIQLEFWVSRDPKQMQLLKDMRLLLVEAAEEAGIGQIVARDAENSLTVILVSADEGWHGWAPTRDEMLEGIKQLKVRLAPATRPQTPVPMVEVDGFRLTPIEESMYHALKATKLMFSPQCRLTAEAGQVEYRVDFLIFYGGKTFAVELDGHDYHKTKQQRGQDAERDRTLKARGIETIRFTGSQIHSDLQGCMFELTDCLTGRKATEI